MMSVGADVPFRVYVCVVCGFLYDEAKGLPEEGIAPGTRWDDIPEDWVCPDCGVGKADFEMTAVS
jgi:rubredoxin